MIFPDSFLDELADRCEIESVVSDYVSLTRRGNNLWGLCPFHNEKTPSFSVSPEKQMYYCFGCGKGGGVINFIMEAEQLSFPDAVRLLSQRAGMEPPATPSDAGLRQKKERLLKLNACAARFFHETLGKPEGAAAAAYMARRGISKGAVTRFGLGAAPDRWDALLSAMAGEGFEKQELLEAGLAVKGSNGGVYDRFRGRLMFPIIDVRGSVAGFGGRVLDDSLPKYLNSPDSPVFHKSRNLFALNFAKKSKQGRIILTEGYMDALTLHQAGFDCAVASLGTALTADHANLLSRYTKEVLLAYDGDEAGTAAANRAIGILERTGLAVKVLRLIGAKDPDEFIRKNGREAFAALINRSEHHVDFRLMQIAARYDLTDADQKVAFSKEAAAMLAALPGPVEREVYGGRAAQAAGISPEAMQLEIKRARGSLVKKERKREARRNLSPAAAMQPKEKNLRYENLRSGLAEEGVLRLLLLDGNLFSQTEELEPAEFSAPLLGKVYEQLRIRWREGKTPRLNALSGLLTSEEMNYLTGILQKPESLPNGQTAMADYIEIIKTQKLRKTAATEDHLLAARELFREKKGYGG